jgi:hypothetical protein
MEKITLPFAPDVRKQKISEIIKGNPVRTGERLHGSGRQDVYAIPLEYLTYNVKNTRFLAEAKTFEAEEKRSLDITKYEDFLKVEQFIFNYRKERNEGTIKSLLQDGQQKTGIITKDGVVISGNRRLRLLNEIRRHPEKYQKENPDRFEELGKFEAIVLEESELTPERMVALETYYQYGEEDKVDYNPIQVYLSAYQQKHDLKLPEEQIANNFKVKVPEVRKWLEVYELMVQYLDHTGQQDRFIALENLEDPFLGLRQALRQLTSFSTAKVNWPYDEIDIEELKTIYFDYLFARDALRGEKNYRDVLAFFRDEGEWKAIRDIHSANVKPLEELKPVQEYEKENPDLKPEKVLQKRRSDFSKENSTALETGFIKANQLKWSHESKRKPSQMVDQIKEVTSEALEYVRRVSKNGKKIDSKDELKTALDKAVEDIDQIRKLLGF